MTAGAEERVDGRLLRGRRTRRAITEAYIALLQEGVRSPRAEQVATRAGVGLRTVYNQFDDLEGLRAEAGAVRTEQMRAYLRPPPDPGLPLAERTEVFVAQRSAFLEALTPYARAAEGRHADSPELTRQREELVTAGREEIEACFGSELDRHSGRGRRRRLDALQVAAGWPAWNALRDELGLDVAEARACLQLTLTGLLAGR